MRVPDAAPALRSAAGPHPGASLEAAAEVSVNVVAVDRSGVGEQAKFHRLEER